MTIASRLAILSLVAVVIAGCATTRRPATVADAAAARPELSTLTKLVNDAGLAETLKAPGPYTVFAPTDEAFKKVPAKTMERLAADKAYLKSVLSYHVLPIKLESATVQAGPAKTVQGAAVTMSKAGNFVAVDEAIVTEADVVATNGVVHVIDRVLLPPVK